MDANTMPSDFPQEHAPPQGDTAEMIRQAAPVVRRLNHAFGPIAAGLALDLMDVLTFGPAGFVLGAPFGALAGYWMGTALRLDRMGIIFCTVAGAIYCTIPFTEILPLGMLVGALARYQDPDLYDEDFKDEEPTGTEA